MLDKEILNKDLFSKSQFNIRVAKPFDKLALDFISDFSLNLRRVKKINLFPDLIYLIFWCAKFKNKIVNDEEKYLNGDRF